MTSWQTFRLGDIADVSAGGTPSRSQQSYWRNGTIPWVKISDMRDGYVKSTQEQITEKGLENSSAKLFSAGTILLSIFASLGEVAMLDISASTNQAIAGITANEDMVHVPYLYHYLKGQKSRFAATGRGVAQNNINLSILRDWQVPIPPMETQRLIAETLDKAQDLIRKRKQQIDLLDEFLRSVFVDMFGDPVSNPKGWRVHKLLRLGQLNRGKSKHRPRNDPALLGGPYPLIQTGDVAKPGLYIKDFAQTYSEVGLAQSKLWPAGTLCITIAANIAKTGILTFDACFPDSVVAFSPNEKTNVNFVQFWFIFLQKIIEANAPESAQKNINLRILENLDVICPPKGLQDRFAIVVQDVEAQRDDMETGLAEMQHLFRSIMQRAFRGELFG